MTVDARDVYRKIKDFKQKAERRERRSSEVLYGIEADIHAKSRQREDSFSQLATIYLPQLDEGSAREIRSNISSAYATVHDIFEEKQRRRRVVERNLERFLGTEEELREQIIGFDGQLEVLATKRESLEEVLDEMLGQHDQYPQLREDLTKKEEEVERNKDRVRESREEARAKLPAYKDSRLFTYLLYCGFGTDVYPYTGLRKRLDRWVSRIVNFEEQKKGYDILSTMPDLLESRVAEKERDLREIAAHASTIEQELAQEIGLTDVMYEGSTVGEKRFHVLEQLGNVEGQIDAYERERRQLDQTKGQYHKRAVDHLKQYLKGEGIGKLLGLAAETPTETDDQLVRTIGNLNVEIRKQRTEARKKQQKRSQLSQVSQDMRWILREFERHDFESSRSYFDSGFNITLLLNGLESGRYSRHQVWSEIEREQNFRARRTSSYGSYSSTTYGGWSSSGSSGGFGGGGFSSGGGFGGGGFSSGGGF